MPETDTARSHRSRIAILMPLFFASGAAALIYEVLWLKELGRLFGVTAHAAATTLAVFFLGLSAGGLVWGRRAARLANPLRTYAVLELGIAGSALLYFFMLDLYHAIYGPLFSAVGDRPALFLLVKFLLASGVLFLPAFLMGGTLPVMAQHLVAGANQLGRIASLLYAVNTLGATVGALLAGFFLPPWLGFRNSYLVAIALNVLIAALALAIARTRDAPSAPREEAASRDAGASAPVSLPAITIWVSAFASGFLTLGLEVLWTRMFSQVLQNSVYTFAVILTVFLFSLALGSVLANQLCRVRVPPGAALASLLALSGLLIGLSPLLFYRLTDGLSPVGTGQGWSGYLVSVFSLAGVVLLPPGILAGSVFPYLMKLSEGSMVSAGRTVGQLASVNTIAAIAGSLAAGFVFLDLFGLWNSLRVFGVAYLALAAILPSESGRRRVPLRAAAAAGIALLSVFLPYADLAQVRLDPADDEQVVEITEGSHGTVAVIRRNEGLGIKVNNSYLLGMTTSAINERLQAWLPLSLHPAPRKVFFLGMGTGITAGAALDFPVERVVVAEINADVVRASEKHLRPWVNGLFDDPRARVVYEDGRNYLFGTRERYDMIIADLFLTFRAGVGSLYTTEHFSAARDRLEPGGMFVQWLPFFDMSEEEFGIVARTMLDVFPHVTLWRRGFSPTYPVFALIGRLDDAPLDPKLMQSRLASLALSGDLPREVWIQNIPLAAYVADLDPLRERFAGYMLSTDDRTPLEYLAPITERNSRGAGTARTLAWWPLAVWLDGLHREAPPAKDPYLSLATPAEQGQVPAGLAFYKFEVLRRLDRLPEAQVYMSEYRRLLGLAPEGASPDG